MEVFDKIREGITPDLLKYKPWTLCRIIDVKSIKGIGLVLNVTPINIDVSQKMLQIEDDEKGTVSLASFAVVCINRGQKYWESNIKEKYFALILNITQDVSAGAPALLVPQTYIDPFIKSGKEKLSDKEKDKIYNKQINNILSKGIM